MPKVKLELRNKSDAELAAYCANHKAKLVGNAAFPAPVPDPAVYDTALSDFQSQLAAYRAALDTAAQLRVAKDASRATLEGVMTQRGAYVELTAPDHATMLSAGLEPRSPASRIGNLPAPQSVVAKMGSLEGEVDLGWDRVRGAASYIIDSRPYNDPTAQWQQVTVSQKARVIVAGLVSGKKYSFRVRAVGTVGPGAWSDDAVVMAP